MAYAILRVAKLKTTGAIGALGQHNERTRETRNADPERQWQNIRLAGSGDWGETTISAIWGHLCPRRFL